MKGIKTIATTIEMRAPEGMEDKCSSLWTQRVGYNQVSVWELTEEEKTEIMISGRIYLNVIGLGHPPVSLTHFNPLSPDNHSPKV